MKRLAFLCMAVAAFATAAAVPAFQAAQPVWPQGRERRMNDFVEFRADFEAKPGDRPVLRLTGSSVYRIRLNGRFAGYGPARAAKGFFRVDEWPLKVSAGRNTLTVEVSAYNCNNFYIPDQPAFLQAEVVSGDRVLAATGRTFKAFETPRVTKCSRFSYQRAFGEAYRLSPEWTGAELPLAEQPAVPLLERIAGYPDFSVNDRLQALSCTAVKRRMAFKYRKANFVDGTAKWLKMYRPETLDVNLWRTFQEIEVAVSAPAQGGASSRLSGGQGVVFDCGLNETGFPGATVTCTRPGRLYFTFAELLDDGTVNPVRSTMANGLVWDLQPGRYSLEAFEPYTFRYLHIFALDGAFEVSAPFVRRYRSAAAERASFRSSDPALDKVFAAAKETFAQNAVDVFTDCPSRERAGWLCDSFFLGRSAALLTGSTDLERLFIQNYLLPERFEHLPDGMLPMCYPSDHPSRNFIPNWAMWFVIEVDEYLKRSGDRATVEALKPRLMKLVNYLKTFRNADGLLEKLPKWVFVEWSEANRLVQDVNYPSNATWAEVLDCMDRLYGMPELAAEASKVRETVRRQAWTGAWFCDNAVRQKDGALKLSGKCTETCQYYMFLFGVATAASHPQLWRTLLDDFGPKRRTTKKHPEIYFSNAFIGNFLRLELLSRARLDRQLLAETKGYFAYMAERTGTLWENDTPHASCNHGFASHVAVFYVKCVLGIERIDGLAHTVTVRKTDVPLEACEATLPVPGGEIVYGWTKKGGRLAETFRAPEGWRLVSASAGSR